MSKTGKAAWVRAQRKELGWTQTRLVDELEVDAGTVSRWERGDLEVDRRTELAIERLVDIQAGIQAGRILPSEASTTRRLVRDFERARAGVEKRRPAK